MKHCNTCGVNVKGEKFCHKCGNKVSKEVQSNKELKNTDIETKNGYWKTLFIVLGILIFLGFIFAILSMYLDMSAKDLTIKIQQDKLQAKEQETQKYQQEKQATELIEGILKSDQDEDGLTNEEESKLGTNPISQDTDNDGIIDPFDTNPLGGGRNIPKQYKWSYGGSEWTWTLGIHSDWYDYYKNLNIGTYNKYPNAPKKTGWTFYLTPNDNNIERLATQLKSKADESNFNPVLFITSFVQNLPYVGDEYTGYDEYHKFPIETLIDDDGDCEDKSYLAASLLRSTGYDVVLISPIGHMMIGVACSDCSGSYSTLNGKKYFVLETTRPGWSLGDLPDKYKGAEVKVVG